MAGFVECRAGAACVLQVSGDIDIATADVFRDRVLDCLERFEAVEVDMSGVTFIDSSGLGALIRLRTEAITRNKDAKLSNLSPATERLLRISGLRDLFTTSGPALEAWTSRLHR